MTAFLDSLPNWAIYVIVVAGALLATEAGYQLGSYWFRRTGAEKASPPGAIAGATVGLLAFMLAIVTGVALNRFDNRRALVLEESNAIGTTYLRADYLEQPTGTLSQDLLREYVDVRLEATVPGQLEAAIVRSEEIQDELWNMAAAQAIAYPDSPLLAIYVESLNQVIDVHAKRLIAIEAARLPGALWTELFIMAGLVMFLVGVTNGTEGRRHLLAMIILALVFSAVILLIVDLDKLQGGFLTVSQEAMIKLQQQLNAP